MAVDYAQESPAEVAPEQLRCALTGKPISAEEAYWAPPLVTFGELMRAIGQGLRTPSTLGVILFAEQPNVPYAQDVREELAARRTSEQLKLLGLLLVIVAIMVVPIVLLTMR